MDTDNLRKIIDGLEISQNSTPSLATITSALIEMDRSTPENRLLVDGLMMRLSVKFEGQVAPEDGGKTWTPPDTFHRSTVKYWCRREDAIQIKLLILPHLPILGTPRSLITSIYLDNEQLSFYHKRLMREDGSSLVRIRYYGDNPRLSSWPSSPLPVSYNEEEEEPVVYIERKMHREAWTGELSTKERASLLVSSLPSFLAGHGPEAHMHVRKTDNTDKNIDLSHTPMSPSCLAPPPSPSTFHRADGKDQERARRATFLREVQHSLISLKASPILKTRYSRTAFQRSDSNAVRLSFDEDVTMTAYPSLETVSFDYCILEIKLEDGDQEAPVWLQKIKGSGLLIECPKFSKFAHGISLLFPSKIKRSPSYFVMGQNPDHLRPATIDELQAADEGSVEGRRRVLEAAFLPRDISTGTMCQLVGNNTEDGSSSHEEEGGGREGEGKVGKAGGGSRTNHLPSKFHQVIDIPPSDDVPPVDDQGCGAKFFTKKWTRMSGPPVLAREAMSLGRSTNSPALVRSRVEPKSFFANERTFLSWLQIAILLMFASLSLMSSSSSAGGGLGGAEMGVDRSERTSGSSRIAGLALAPIAMGLFVYALMIYRARTASMMRREVARFDDQRGPVLIVILLLVVCSFIFALHLREG